MRWLLLTLLVLLVALQYRLWFAEGSLAEQHRLRREDAENASKYYEFRFSDKGGHVRDIAMKADQDLVNRRFSSGSMCDCSTNKAT